MNFQGTSIRGKTKKASLGRCVHCGTVYNRNKKARNLTCRGCGNNPQFKSKEMFGDNVEQVKVRINAPDPEALKKHLKERELRKKHNLKPIRHYPQEVIIHTPFQEEPNVKKIVALCNNGLELEVKDMSAHGDDITCGKCNKIFHKRPEVVRIRRDKDGR